MRFGAFTIPLHELNEDPQLMLWRDMQLIELFDQLNYDEYWLGEHHSGGWANIVAPELVLAAAAERTKHIKLASGVLSLPYHNPYMIAARAVQLDHLMRGRFILGVGAGSIPSDPYILGIDQGDTRARTEEALEVVLHLLRSEEPITHKADWFTLQDARLQIGPYSRPGLEVAISSATSPVSARLAGKHDLGMMSFGAPRPGFPPVDLAGQWGYVEEEAAKAGNVVDRADWRITMTAYVGETRDQAIADVRAGFDRWLHDYWGGVFGIPVEIEGVKRGQELDHWIETGGTIVGSVDDCIASIEQMQTRTGGFGKLLLFTHDWASWDKMKRSYELFARYVAPNFTGALRRQRQSAEWVRNNHDMLLAGAAGALEKVMPPAMSQKR
jgi:limonene 1,2-monooxygenase